jgi:hypothetical protein
MHMIADNNANRQLGIIMAVRETTRVFKHHLTKVSSNEYDQNVVIADTDFRNNAQKWIMPSADPKIATACAICTSTSSACTPIPRPLANSINATTSLSGSSSPGATCSATHTPISTAPAKDDGSAVHSWDVDDYFYHAQGYAHVMYYTMRAVKREYHQAFTTKPVAGATVRRNDRCAR